MRHNSSGVSNRDEQHGPSSPSRGECSLPETSEISNNSPALNLGQWLRTLHPLEDLSSFLSKFETEEFQSMTQQRQFYTLCSSILSWIRSVETPCFLLPGLFQRIEQINARAILESPFRFANFEMWLNVFSGLSPEENILVRSKLVGRYLPRSSYGAFFPIQGNMRLRGTHFVTAHSSPDLDTGVASFWGWVDAFGVQLSDSLHIWNLPGGTLSHQDRYIFEVLFGPEIFNNGAKARSHLTLSALDLLNRESLVTLAPSDTVASAFRSYRGKQIAIVDAEGYFLGSWRDSDYEGVQRVVSLLNSCLRSIQSTFYHKLTGFFAQPNPCVADFETFACSLEKQSLKQAAIELEMTPGEQELLGHYINVLISKLCDCTEPRPQALEITFGEFACSLDCNTSQCDALNTPPPAQAIGSSNPSTCIEAAHVNLGGFTRLLSLLREHESTLFDAAGVLTSSRALIFKAVNDFITSFERAIGQLRRYVETFEIALLIKERVLQVPATTLSVKADYTEVVKALSRSRLQTVVYPEKSGRLVPLGVIDGGHIQSGPLGSVSLRDFCNRDEVSIPPYLEIASIIDHHKCDIQSMTAPVAIMSNTQSCNTLVAQIQETLNRRYTASDAPSSKYWVSEQRIIYEAFMMLFAIIDDTDSLSKVSPRDLHVIADILNTLMRAMPTTERDRLLDFSDIEDGDDFTTQATRRLLSHQQLYSIYSLIYHRRSQALSTQVLRCLEGATHDLFADTKLQNGCARVGQIKVISAYFKEFAQNIPALQRAWQAESTHFHASSREIDLFIQMISTIPGAQELYSGQRLSYQHQDELWIWIPHFDRAYDHLTHFLRGLCRAPNLARIPEAIKTSIKCPVKYPTRSEDSPREGDRAPQESRQESSSTAWLEQLKRLQATVKLNFSQEALIHESDEVTSPLLIITFPPSTLNSRKAGISPHLPAKRI